jgi:hypothetical protein
MPNRVRRAGRARPHGFRRRRATMVLLAVAGLIAGLPLAAGPLATWLGDGPAVSLLAAAARAQETPPATPGPAPVAAAAPDVPAIELPPAEQIIEQAIDASGGRAALEKIHSRVIHGALEVPAVGIKASLAVYTEEPNKVYNVAESDAIGKIESGTDGEVYWESTMMTGPRIKDGEEKASAVREARFHNDLEWRSLYKQAETTGVADIGGRRCYKVTMTPPEGKPEYLYYDAEDHLLRKMESTLVSTMGEIRVETFVEDYRAQDGIQVPFRSRQVFVGMQEMILTTESVAHNVDIPDSVFALPAEIQALLAKPAGDRKSTE